MTIFKVTLCTLTFTACDFLLSSILYIRSCKKPRIIQDVVGFDMFHSVLDVWGTSILRVCICSGAVIGVLSNRQQGPKRLKVSIIAITLLCYLIAVYTLIKLLLYSEYEKPVKDPWFWGLLAWTWIASAGTHCSWIQMSKIPSKWAKCRLHSHSNGDQDQKHNDDQKQKAKTKVSRANIGKLLSYSKQDAVYLILAFVFLLLCTLGDIISRLTSDTTIVSDVVSENLNIFLRSLVKAAGVIAFMFSLSWQLSLLTFMGFPLIILVSRVYGTYYKKLAKEVQTALAQANSTAEETISSIKTVRSFANEDTEASVYKEKLLRVYALHKKEAIAYTYYVWSTGFTQLILQISILYYGGHLVISEQMTSGNLISFVIYEFLLGGCMESVGSVYGGLMKGVGAAEKVFEFIDRKPKMENNGTLAPEQLEGKVEFKNVTFSYPTRPSSLVLQNLSFTLYPGKVTALVGPSGSGKSSCVNILENFYPVQNGEVLLDGQPIDMYNHKYLHGKISLVSQEPVLFARSIENNISYGLNSVPLEAAVSAAKTANAHSFITELHEGYKTETGEKGAQLSGGQKQRVAIARSLIRNPQVLILDEATSALDAESEHAIQQAMNSNLQNRTVLIVAHRLSTVEKAHNIIVLDKGRVVQQGNHSELMEQGGLYSHLVQRQVSGFEPATEEKDHTRPPSTAEPHSLSAVDLRL
ncbi:ATP-binding cassette sub-family B member 9 isoform X2 [Xenopus laevis]|uniref:ATP-binding cassette sub-family B member 9 isoform X2 n=1 Tax=Xenopus laevis TaxID=8355 RepID=A0A8J0VAG9_XENLA|nr:ATP-binding cassette sub-family B member 9 isoform X2 [Xenopus laevis]